jgi:hypothetical protein
MFQCWGTTDREKGWLAAGIEEQIETSLKDWPGSAVFAEYGYERNTDLPLVFPGFRHTDANHNRRGAWRGAFSGLGVINGFENTWGPAMILDQDQEGVAYLANVRRFFVEIAPFARMRPAPDLLAVSEYEAGCRPLVLATPERDVVAVYFAALGTAGLDLSGRQYDAHWYDPRTGELLPAVGDVEAGLLQYVAPLGYDAKGRPWDWVLVVQERV